MTSIIEHEISQECLLYIFLRTERGTSHMHIQSHVQFWHARLLSCTLILLVTTRDSHSIYPTMPSQQDYLSVKVRWASIALESLYSILFLCNPVFNYPQSFSGSHEGLKSRKCSSLIFPIRAPRLPNRLPIKPCSSRAHIIVPPTATFFFRTILAEQPWIETIKSDIWS